MRNTLAFPMNRKEVPRWSRRCMQILLLAAALTMTGCYSPLSQERSATSTSIDFSGLVGILDAPTENGWVIDIYLFNRSDVRFEGDSFRISSRTDSIQINGQPFVRFFAGESTYSPPRFRFENPLPESGTAVVNGIPVGGPYVMAVQIWLDGTAPGDYVGPNPPNPDPGPWVITAANNEPPEWVSFAIQQDAVTNVSGESFLVLENVWGLRFDDEAEYAVSPGT